MSKRKRRKGVEESPEVLKKRAKELAEEHVFQIKERMPAIFALLFNIGKQTIAIDAKFVKEILNPFTIKWVPFTPSFIAGVVNLRGDIITVFDIAELFEIKHKDLNPESEIIILKNTDITCGILVDFSLEIIRVNEEELLESIPSDKKLSSFVNATINKDNKLYQVIDLIKILHFNGVVALSRSLESNISTSPQQKVA